MTSTKECGKEVEGLEVMVVMMVRRDCWYDVCRSMNTAGYQ